MMKTKSNKELMAEIDRLQSQLIEAKDTLEAIRTGQVDALVVTGQDGHSLYTLKSADLAYRVFVEQMNEGAVTLNSDGLILYSNSKFSSMINRPLSEVLGKPFSMFILQRDRLLFDTLFNAGWQGSVKSEICLVPDEYSKPVQLSLSVLELDNEIALSIIITDLTGQKKNEHELKLKNEQLEALNEALISSNHDLQQFASVASHDLQEPIRKIQVFSKFLKDRSSSELSDDSKLYVEKIISSAHRMKALVVDILTYSRLSANETNFEAVDLNVLMREIMEDLDLKISEKKAIIDLSDLPVVDGNKGQLRQVFNNLLSNALKFTSPGRNPHIAIQRKQLHAKELGVSLERREEYCRISIKDNGIGFDEKFVPVIFSLFEKLNPKSLFEGSGIGLAIAKKIIDKHHGLIIAKSVVGKGSEFNIIVPVKQKSWEND